MTCNYCDRDSRATLFFDTDEGRIEKEVCSLHFLQRASFMQVHQIWPELDEEDAKRRGDMILTEASGFIVKEALVELGFDEETIETLRGWNAHLKQDPREG